MPQSDKFQLSPTVTRIGVAAPWFAGAWCNECPYAVRKLFALSEISGTLARRGRKRHGGCMTHIACPGVDGPAPSAVSRKNPRAWMVDHFPPVARQDGAS